MRRPPSSTLTGTLFPYTTLLRCALLEGSLQREDLLELFCCVDANRGRRRGRGREHRFPSRRQLRGHRGPVHVSLEVLDALDGDRDAERARRPPSGLDGRLPERAVQRGLISSGSGWLTMAAAWQILRDERGNAAVEFAFVLPILLTLFIGVVEGTKLLRLERKVVAAARSEE